MAHPALKDIDRQNPYFRRTITRRLEHEDQSCELRIWLPVLAPEGCWVTQVELTGASATDLIGVGIGEDPLDAIVAAMKFVRYDMEDQMEKIGASFLFGEQAREMGGLPAALDRGLPPSDLLEVEQRATADVIDRFQSVYGIRQITG